MEPINQLVTPATAVIALVLALGGPVVALPSDADAQAELPGIQVSGRTERRPDGWRATWPAVAWRAAFSGTSVAVLTQDSSAYRVEIDRREMDAITPSEERKESWYRGLPLGDHLIEIIRMNVTRSTPGYFFGFKLDTDGRWLASPPHVARQIEFIGDSQSAGYGDRSMSSDCADDEVPSLSDASQSYAVLTARQLHADWQLNAMNAIGVVRNWSGIWPGTTIQNYISLTLQSEPASVYRDPEWHPQVLVLWLGGNDFSTPLAKGEPWTRMRLKRAFDKHYRALVLQLRQRLGASGLIIVVQPHTGSSPANSMVRHIVEHLRSQGDRQIYYFELPSIEETGCYTHPTLADHRLISTAMSDFIESHARLP
jgi:lysophospholipase L1-like esterase